MIYERPSVNFYDVAVEGFICASDPLLMQVDRWDSYDGGNINMDDDAVEVTQ